MTPKPSERLGAYFRSRREKGKAGLPTLSVTLDRGLVLRDSIDRKMETNLSPDEHLRVYPGDIAYNMMRMWQGASGMAEADGIVSPAYVVLAPKPNVDPLFASYLFKTSEMIHRFWAFSYGLTDDRLRLYPRDFTLIPATLPPLPEQQKIAEILGTWDKAIETTEALLANARTQKRALMQSLLTGTRRFPGFEDHPWREVRLGDVSTLVTKGTTPTSVGFEFTNHGVSFVKAENIDGSGTVAQSDVFVSQECHDALRRSQLEAGDILVTIAGAIGRVGLVPEEILPANTNQAVAIIRMPSDADISRSFVSYWLRGPFIQSILRDTAAGGAQPNVNLAQVSNLPMKCPTHPEQELIVTVIDDASLQVEQYVQQLNHLRTEKKSLMQQLLTGKRRVVV